VEDLAKRPLKELMQLARERFGAKASTLKTREELVQALRADSAPGATAAAPAEPQAPVIELVTQDFFRRRGT
jgi:hypothetical protein